LHEHVIAAVDIGEQALPVAEDGADLHLLCELGQKASEPRHTRHICRTSAHLNLIRRRRINLLQALAQFIHFIAYLSHKRISVGWDAVVAAINFLQ
jgi:hypothetical protein